VPEQERQLLERARSGDLDAFAAFVRHFERRVRTVLFRLLDDARDVEEATQDTFVQAWRNLDRFRGDAAPFTWLYRIATNEALQRRRRARVDMVEFSDEHVPEVDSVLEAGELRVLLVKEIRALPFEHRTALVLRDLEGLSNQEVAAALGITVGAAKRRIHRARMTLRERLGQVEGLS
jgi:RNA polymerase sigma-70 factor, ECF subfamily